MGGSAISPEGGEKFPLTNLSEKRTGQPSDDELRRRGFERGRGLCFSGGGNPRLRDHEKPHRNRRIFISLTEIGELIRKKRRKRSFSQKGKKGLSLNCALYFVRETAVTES